MKKTLIILLLALCSLPSMAQSCYWVFLTDKQGSSFDPYTYFDAHAIERYKQNGADLYDITNYPVSQRYLSQIQSAVTEEVGESRWLNAVAVTATPAQVRSLQEMPFVSRVVMIGEPMQMAQAAVQRQSVASQASEQRTISDQLLRMQGRYFIDKGFNGKGIRIAVLDGGFPHVNTHKAFQHLRDNNRILDTWNFPNKKSDVYGWNSHGLNTLSCITGMVDTLQLGLATGAEFLLYRTEIEAEPFKEEVWWMQAMERADQHGANIISSSLGYGKERYFTKDMDGTSYVAHAANLAARKGILVCNSAGNEGDDKSWRTIITPSDADSALCVAGINPSLGASEPTEFSSLGPSADGRLKPNVCAFGWATVASTKGDDRFDQVAGTSFSCPLVAGFAACAWQACPGKTAMEMFKLIQQSADNYPYYDYALGYGVPQASFFTGDKGKQQPTFEYVVSQDSVAVRLLKNADTATIYFNKQRPDGGLEQYSSCTIYNVKTTDQLRFHKGTLDTCTLNVCYRGYTASYRLSKEDQLRMKWEPRTFEPEFKGSQDRKTEYNYRRDKSSLITSNWGSNSRYSTDYYLMFGDMIGLGSSNEDVKPWSPTFHVGFRVIRAFTKSYKWGLGVEYASTKYNLSAASELDDLYSCPTEGVDKRYYHRDEVAVELFQRIRLIPTGGLFSNGVNLDLGVYGTWGTNRYDIKYDSYPNADGAEFSYKDPTFQDAYKWGYGATARFIYDWIGLYLRYRLNGLGETESSDSFNMNLPRLEAGLVLNF